MKKKYKQLGEEQRYQIAVLLDAGKNKSVIADLLGVHKSTVGREINRNTGKRGQHAVKYVPRLAQRKTTARYRTKDKSVKFTESLKLQAANWLRNEQLSPETNIIGVEPAGAACMKTSIEDGVNTALEHIDNFVDVAAVAKVGDLTFEICKTGLEDIVIVPEGKVCTTILRMYNEEAIVVEPAGALTNSALDFDKKQIKGKTVVCVVSGSNNDITRMQEIKERSLLYEGLKHYFLVQFPQRPEALKIL